MKKSNILIIIVLLLVILPINVYMDNDNTQINEEVEKLKQRVEKINTEKSIIEEKLDLQTNLNKMLIERENDLLNSTDNLINHINSSTTVLAIIVGVIVTLGTVVSTIGTFVVQNNKYKTLENEINKTKEEFKTSVNEYNKSKAGYEETISRLMLTISDFEEMKKQLNTYRSDFSKVLEEFKHLSVEVIETQNNAAAIQEDISNYNNNYEEMKNELEKIRDEVQKLVGKAKQSEIKAKQSENNSKATEYFNKAYSSKDINEQIDLYTKAIKLNPEYALAYNNRGVAYTELKRHEDSYKDHLKAFEIKPEDSLYLENLASTCVILGDAYIRKSENDKATDCFNNSIKYYNKAIEIRKTSDNYNGRADTYKKLKKYKLALSDLNEAIKLDASNGYAYSTLAEIKAEQGDDKGFYKNVELALKNGCKIWEFFEKDHIYQKYLKEDSFNKLIDEYRKVV